MSAVTTASSDSAKPAANLRSPALNWAIRLLPVVVAAIACGWGLRGGLPLCPLHTDEDLLINRALAFGSGDLNPHWFVWGSFPMYLNFLAYVIVYVFGRLLGHWHGTQEYAVAYVANPTAIVMTARLISAMSAVVAVEITRRMTQSVAGPVAGLIAGLSLALYPSLTGLAHQARPDTIALALTTFVWWLLICIYQRPGSWRLHILFGIAAGFSLATKVTIVTVLVAYPLVVLLSPQRERAGVATRKMLLGAVVALVACFVGWPYAFLDFRAAYDDIVQFQGSINRVRQESALDLMVQVGQHLAGPAGWGILAVPLLLVGVWAWWRRMGWVWFVPVLAHLALLAVQGRFQYNWFMPLAPLVTACIGAGVVTLAGLHWSRPAVRVAVAAAVMLAMWVPMAGQVAANDRFCAGPHTATAAQAWIIRNVPPGSGILVDTSLLELRPQVATVDRWVSIIEDNPGGRRHHHLLRYLRLQREVGKMTDEPTYDIYSVRHDWWLPTEQAAAQVKGETPTAPYHERIGGKTADHYRKLGVRYLVSDESTLKRYNTSRYPSDQRFYDDFHAQADLAAEFVPTDGLYGDRIEIWRLR